MENDVFPVLEMEMTKDGLKIRLANEKASLEATLPEQLVGTIAERWQAFQDGTAADSVIWGRSYVGAWSKE